MRLLLAIILTIVPCIVLAAPGQPTPSGTYSHGETITLSVNSPGAKSTAAPNLWDTVDNISSYSALGDGDAITTGGSNPWADQSTLGNGDEVKCESTGSDQRGVSTACYRANSAESGYLLGRTLSGASQIYIAWWFNPASMPASGSNKFVRLSNSTYIYDRTFSWTRGGNNQSYVFYNPDYCSVNWHDWGGTTNQWNLLEVWMSDDRGYEITVNGTEVENASWSGCSDFDWNYVWMLGWDANEAGAAISWRMDDIYIDSTPSRVILCSGSTWSARGHCEIQPATSWSDGTPGTIQVTFNQGSFQSEDVAYFYVVDSTNAASPASDAITIGGSQSGGQPKTYNAGAPAATYNAAAPVWTLAE